MGSPKRNTRRDVIVELHDLKAHESANLRKSIIDILSAGMLQLLLHSSDQSMSPRIDQAQNARKAGRRRRPRELSTKFIETSRDGALGRKQQIRQTSARVATALELAREIHEAIATRAIRNQAEVARQLGVSRARITHLLALTALAPDIQERVLAMKAVNGHEPISERALRPIARMGDWQNQRAAFEALETAPLKHRFTEDQKVTIVREAERNKVSDVAKRHHISNQTIYDWRKQFGPPPKSSQAARRDRATWARR